MRLEVHPCLRLIFVIRELSHDLTVDWATVIATQFLYIDVLNLKMLLITITDDYINLVCQVSRI